VEALRRRLAVQDPEQGSMLLVLFAIMVVGSLTIISVATAVKAQQSTRHDEGFTQALPVAD